MDYVYYQGQITENYELLHNGYVYYIPMDIDNKKAHKMLDRQERNERRWNYILENMGKLGIIWAAILFMGFVWLQIISS
jgi:hypothetical protein